MKFLIISKSKIYDIPPLISAIYILRDLGHHVHLITCGINDMLRREFNIRGVEIEIVKCADATSTIFKIKEYLKFRYYVKKAISRESFDCLWVEGGPTIRSIGVSILKDQSYILQISELHEDAPAQLKAIGKVIKQALIVFMPEYNRTAIYQAWFKLPKRPIVLPNKPYFLPGRDILDTLIPRYQEYVDIFKSKRVILYQGWISRRNRDMTSFLCAASQLGEDFLFVMMGRDADESIAYYKTLYPRLMHIEFIPAPDYLLLTSLCYIGIITYNPDKLNQTYCAPNKIFEYGAYGKPMIGNNLPGLHILKTHCAGCIVEQNDVNGILEAYVSIHKDYNKYSVGATNLFNSTDNKKTISNALGSISL